MNLHTLSKLVAIGFVFTAGCATSEQTAQPSQRSAAAAGSAVAPTEPGTASPGPNSDGPAGTTARTGGSAITPTNGGSPLTAAVLGWVTYHHDASRSGVDPASPPAGSVTRAWSSPALDGAIYAEPLVLDGQVIVATENNTVYSFDASTGSQHFKRHLGPAVDGKSLPCGNINPSGITGTPVIDPGSKTLWVVANEAPAHHRLYELNLTTGAVIRNRPADPTGSDPTVQQQRGALTLANRTVYVPYGGLFGDCGEYHGWMVGFPKMGEGDPVSWMVPNAREAGIWAPPGATVDSNGDLFVATGNGTTTDAFADGNSVVRLSPTLAELDSFAPSNWQTLDSQDLDLGSAGPAVLADRLIFQAGKEGVGYLLRADHLGGVGGQAFQGRVCTAFGSDAVEGSTVYVPCREGLFAVKVLGGDSPSFAVKWSTSVTAGPPIVAGGIVWSINSDGLLEGFDQSSGERRFHFDLGHQSNSFPSLAAANGMIFAPADNKLVGFKGV